MKLIVPALILATASSASVAFAEEPLNLDDETARISYSLGYQIGGDFKRQQVDMDAAAVVMGIRDAVSDTEPKIPAPEMQQTLVQLKQKVVSVQKQRSVERELERVAEGKAFLEQNATKEGVVTTDSGLQYKIIEPGTGPSPGPEDQVTVHYRGTLVDGMEFDSSHKRGKPATFKLNGVIKGWSEGLQLTKAGGKVQLFIPENLAYGGRGPLAHRTLIFDVELLSVGEPTAETPAGSQGGEAKAGE